MVSHLLLNSVCFIFITGLYARTLVVYMRRYGFKRTGRQWQLQQQGQLHRGQRLAQQKQRQHAALWRLVLLLACFETIWLLVIINDFRTMRRGGGLETGMGDAPSTFMVRGWNQGREGSNRERTARDDQSN